jgi:hypothetical protein
LVLENKFEGQMTHKHTKLDVPDWFINGNYNELKDCDLFDYYINFKKRVDSISGFHYSPKDIFFSNYQKNKNNYNSEILEGIGLKDRIESRAIKKKINEMIHHSPIQRYTRKERQAFYTDRNTTNLSPRFGINANLKTDSNKYNDCLKVMSCSDLENSLSDFDWFAKMNEFGWSKDETHLLDLERKRKNEMELQYAHDHIHGDSDDLLKQTSYDKIEKEIELLQKSKNTDNIYYKPIDHFFESIPDQIQIQIDLRFPEDILVKKLKKLLNQLGKKKPKPFNVNSYSESKKITNWNKLKVFEYFDLKYWYHINDIKISDINILAYLFPEKYYDEMGFRINSFDKFKKDILNKMDKLFHLDFITRLEAEILSDQEQYFKT